MYEPRTYQHQFNTKRFKSFRVVHKETELWIGIDPASYKKNMVDVANNKIVELRTILDDYLKKHPEFQKSLVPIRIVDDMPKEAKLLCAASQKAGIGPMSAIAGLFAQAVGEEISKNFSVNEMVIENGGDLYLDVMDEITISVYAGSSPLSQKVGMKLPANETPIGVCTSAGTVGPSLSFGKADAVMVACKNTLVADAFATALGNMVKSEEDIFTMIKSSEIVDEIEMVIAIVGDKIGIRGNFDVTFLK